MMRKTAWRTFTWDWCNNCGEDGHTSKTCARVHEHQWQWDGRAPHRRCVGCAVEDTERLAA